MKAVLSIGSNMSDSQVMLTSVYRDFMGQIVGSSSIYRTPAWGLTDQPDFLNAVMIVNVAGSPLDLLRRGQRLEREANRKRGQRWGPRTLDVDIVAAWESTDPDAKEITSETSVLTLPHPWAYRRGFVLIPWAEIEPEAKLHGQPIAKWIEAVDAEERDEIVKVGRLWSPPGGR